jgi:prophage regulatory protein
MCPRLLRLNEVLKLVGISRSTLYRLLSEGDFPERVYISERCVGWTEDSIHDWVVKKLEQQR